MKNIAEEYGMAVLYALAGFLVLGCLGKVLAVVSAF